MIKVYCYGIFADTMTDEEFYEVEKNQRECHAAWAENFSAVSELLEMNPVIDNLSMDNKTDEYIVWLVEMMDDSKSVCRADFIPGRYIRFPRSTGSYRSPYIRFIKKTCYGFFFQNSRKSHHQSPERG